jgi:hypothetical protein
MMLKNVCGYFLGFCFVRCWDDALPSPHSCHTEMTEAFSLGSEVCTHSLTSVQYNGLTGTVAGAAIEKNGTIRIPVSLQLDKEDKKDMLLQPKNLTIIHSLAVLDEDVSTAGLGIEMKECRCMFCGESLLLESEDAAVAHMEVCPSLQEQLNDTEHQFTLPQSMK